MNLLLGIEASASAFLEWIEHFATTPGVLVLVLVGSTLVSEDLTCISGGILAAKGWIAFPVATMACALGIWLGDLGLYGLGRLAGSCRGRWAWARRVASPERVAKGRHLFDRYGVRWVFLSRFLPGMRLPSYLAAGAVGWSFRRFALALAVAALLWTPLLCGLAYFAGRVVLTWVESYQRWAWPILILAVLLLWVLVRVLLPLFSWRGRRLLHSRWIRIRDWEFWPVWAIYPPVVLCLAWQALRLRGATLFTCCNPAIPCSGVAMESKGDILDALVCPDPERIRVASYLRLEPASGGADRFDRVAEFMRAEAFDYPVVLKPDVGERGQGVSIVHDEAEARRWLEAYHGPALVQEFIGGCEFGIQWCRQPNAARGEITSLAGKHPQFLRGDGTRSLEKLILEDSRAIAMAPYYLAKFEGRLEEIPADGEQVNLTEIGTHARGAIFTDERQLVSEDLRRTMDAVGLGFDGFHLGRYDVRVSSEEDLQRGRGLVILELNGVTGEPIHIYQPGFAWWRGVRDLCRHWTTACEIGARNRARGVRPMSVLALWSLARTHRRQLWFEADNLPGGDDE